MFLLAAGGAAVVKHGNRGISSKCGGADVLEALGVKIELAPERLRHAWRRRASGSFSRRRITPPSKPSRRCGRRWRRRASPPCSTCWVRCSIRRGRNTSSSGIFSEALLPKYAEVLRLLGRRRAWAVHGSSGPLGGGVDELSTLGVNHYCAVEQDRSSAHALDPASLGFPRAEIEQLRGGDCAANARILTGILEGHIHGAKRDVVVLNAAAGFVVCGLAGNMAEGVLRAQAELDSGAALARLDALRQFSARRV